MIGERTGESLGTRTGSRSTRFIEISTATPEASFTESLNEMGARRTRHATATFDETYVEDTLNNYIWQPETLCYTDQTTGNEVWRLTQGTWANNWFHNDIGVPVWSADGKRLAMHTYRNTQAYTTSASERKWFISDTDGTKLRPVRTGPSRLLDDEEYINWSPQLPDVYYHFGRNNGGQTGRNLYDLYKTTVTDTDATTAIHLTFPSGDGALQITKLVSSDGKSLTAFPWSAKDTLYPATIEPTASLSDADGNSVNSMGGQPYGVTPTTVTDCHDQYPSLTGSEIFVNPTGTGGQEYTWWQIDTTGSAADGGALFTGRKWTFTISAKTGTFTGSCTFSPSGATGTWIADDGTNLEVYLDAGSVAVTTSDTMTCNGETCSIDTIVSFDQYGEVVPINTDSGFGGTNDPFTNTYWSHFVPDRWGQYALFSYGEAWASPGFWEIAGTTNYVNFGTDCAQHHAWSAFSDWAITTCSASGGVYNNPYDYPVWTCKFNDVNSATLVCLTHSQANGGIAYYSNPRPAQSPDGTKAGFHSEFLNPSADQTDIFWAVAMAPFPPTDLAASGTGQVDLTWLPPTYSDRGWPTASDPAPYAREVKQYRVWRSTTSTGPWTDLGVETQGYTNHATYGLYATVADCAHTDTPGNGTWYYALTTEEHCGLSGDTLSEILEVVVAGGNVSTTTVVAVKGQTGFWTSAPSNVSGFSVVDETPAGHKTISWTEPTDTDDIIRYYNVYYSDNGIPSATQVFRCASLPKGTSSWLDWLAAQTGTSYYRVTTVDKYGNESAGVTGSV